jgi:photosystem II stability/assembly factor-like uncharacterized protein
MKNFLIICILIIIYCNYKGISDNTNHWKLLFDPKIAFKNTSDSLLTYISPINIYCPDSLNFIFFDKQNDAIIISTDGGESWNLAAYNYNYNNNLTNLKSTACPTPEFMIQAFNSGIQLRSINGGNNWDTIYTNLKLISCITDFSFLKDGHGLGVGYHYNTYKREMMITIDHGATWVTLVNIPLLKYLLIPKIISDSIFACIGYDTAHPTTNYFCISKDYGNTWNNYKLSPQNSPYFLYFDSTSSNGWSAFWGKIKNGLSSELIIQKTNDGGKTWISIFEDSIYNYTGVLDFAVYDSLNICAFGWYGNILRTKDGGATWSIDTSMKSIDFNGCSHVYGKYLSNKRLLITISDGKIFLYDDDGFPDEKVLYSVYQDKSFIYPNPVYSLCNINVTLSEACLLKFDIIDIFGQSILSINKYSNIEFVNAGEYKKSIDLSGLATGIYYLIIYADKEKYIQKFIKIE